MHFPSFCLTIVAFFSLYFFPHGCDALSFCERLLDPSSLALETLVKNAFSPLAHVQVIFLFFFSTFFPETRFSFSRRWRASSPFLEAGLFFLPFLGKAHVLF